MNSLIEYFAKQKLFGDLLTIFVIVVGIGSTFLIQREIFPNVAFDVITVTTIFPAASPEEVEKLITNPLEQDLQEVDGIKKLQSISVEGRSYIVVQLDPDQTSEEKAKSDIQDVVDRFELPNSVERPTVTSLESKQNPIIEVTIAGDIPEMELREKAKQLEKDLESISGVARVVLRGVREREIRVETDPKKLSTYRLAIDDVVMALKQQNLNIPAGTLEASKGHAREKIVRTIGEFKTNDDIKNTVIRANDLGNPVLIKDVAKVFNSLEKATIMNRTNGVPSMSLTVLKKEKADAIIVVDKVREKMKEMEHKLEGKVKVSFVRDMSIFIKRRINILTGNLMVGLVLVLLVLAAILPFRVALLASLGIPFSFLGTMFFFNWFGYSINLISLLGLIIVCGMLVDDAIVVTDNAVRLTEEGMSSEDAAIKGTQQIWPAVVASVMTTVFAFLPMMFMTGIFGKFIKQIPLGVIIALAISMFEAFFILPQHFIKFIRPRAKNIANAPARRKGVGRVLQTTANFWDNWVVPKYMRFLKVALRFRYLVALGTVLLFAGSIVLATKGMRFQLFPPEGIDIFFIKMQTPTGTSLEATSDLVKPIEKIVGQVPKKEMEDFVTMIGMQQQDTHDPSTKRGGEYAQITLYLSPETDRTRTAADIMEDLRVKIGTPPGFERVTFDRVSGGPPVGKPVSIGVRASEYEKILPAMRALKEVISNTPGVKDITDSFIQGKEELQVRVDGAEAAAARLSVLTVGNTIRGAFDGIVATSVQQLDDEIDVRVSFPPQERADEATLGKILIPNPIGNLVPLSSVAKVERGQNLATYDHENNQREVKISADVDAKVTSAQQVNSIIREKLPELSKQFPEVKFAFGGEDADTQESLASLGRAFLVAFFAIFLMLVLTFKTILQPLLVVITIPLGIIAVIWAFFFHGMPLSFMGMLGIIALAGVIVNNAIVFVDFVNQQRAAGANHYDSIVNSAKMRIRPIFLTTCTTVAGLLPTAYGIGGLDKFVVPIAMALGWGLLFGSVLTAFVFPAAVSILDDIQALPKRLFRSKKSSALEPIRAGH